MGYSGAVEFLSTAGVQDGLCIVVLSSFSFLCLSFFFFLKSKPMCQDDITPLSPGYTYPSGYSILSTNISGPLYPFAFVFWLCYVSLILISRNLPFLVPV